MSNFFSLNVQSVKTPPETIGTKRSYVLYDKNCYDTGCYSNFWFIYSDRDPRLYTSNYEYVYEPGGYNNYELSYEAQPFNGYGVCGLASMSEDGIFDYTNNHLLSSFVNPVWRCSYDAALFTKTSQLAEYKALLTTCGAESSTGLNCFRNNEGTWVCEETVYETQGNVLSCTAAAGYYNTLLLPTFCGRQHISTEDEPCPNNQDSCSVWVANSAEGAYCRRWEEENKSDTDILRLIDNTKEQYCLNHPNEEDCACLARSLNPNYNEIRISSADYCWYVPCIENSTHLTVSRDAALVSIGGCSNACSQIFNIYTSDPSSDIIFTDEFILNIDCDFADAGTPGEGGGGSSPIEPIEPSFWDQYGDIVLYSIAGIAGIVLLIIILTVLIMSSRKTK